MSEKKTITKIKKKINKSIQDSLNPKDPSFCQLELSQRIVLQKAEIDGYLKGLFDYKQITETERYDLSEEFKKKLLNEIRKLR